MAITYTPSQQKAIYTKNKSLLLSAGAGSGKTAVLVQRIIELISDDTNDVEIDNLLVVTFTNTAASQMKDRIYKAINIKIKENPNNKKLKKQLLMLGSANIKTIHSFCLDLIKSNINNIDIPINFKIADAAMANSLKLSVAEEYINEKYSQNDSDFFLIKDTFAHGRDDSNFISLITNIYDFLQSLSDIDGFIDMCLKNSQDAATDFSVTPYATILKDYVNMKLNDNIVKYKKAIEQAQINFDYDQYSKFFETELLFLNSVLRKDDLFEKQTCLKEYEFPSIPRKKSGTDTSYFKKIRDDFKADCKKIIQFLQTDKAQEENCQKEIFPAISAIINTVKDFSVRYAQKKRKKSLIDFSDFEHLAYSLLKNDDFSKSEVATSISENFYEILIDEYQDTSDIQNAIFSLVSKNETNLFMVGDVKQCIYKFRQAKPEIFVGKRKAYAKAAIDKELILLLENFRSSRAVIDSVNTTFLPLMTSDVAMTDYKDEQLVPGRAEIEGMGNLKTEFLIWETPSKKELFDSELSDSNAEGLMVAQRIKEIISNNEIHIPDEKTGELRNVNYSDMVILTRNMTSYSHSFYNTLVEKGIPVSADFSEDFYSQIEIMTILGILRAIDNPLDDISLLSLLKNPTFHFTESELLEIRLLSTNTPYYYALLKSENEKSKNVLKIINKLSSFSVKNQLTKTIQLIYLKLNLYEHFSLFRNYEQRLYNLDVFYSMAKEYESSNISSLKGFLQYLDKIIPKGKTIPNITENKNNNSVKIMSMHKSKGLEFSIVFVLGMAKSFSKMEFKERLIINSDLGIGTDYINKEKMYLHNTLCKSALKIKVQEEQVGEEMRLLYVVMTRARDKLILCGTVNDYEKQKTNWSLTHEFGFTKNTLMSNNSFIDWVMPTALFTNVFDIKLYNLKNIFEIKNSKKEETKITKVLYNESVFFNYPFSDKTNLPLKVTVSGINKENSDNFDSKKIYIDDLDDLNNKVGGSEFGTYFHKIFELLDIEKIKKGENIDNVIAELISDNIIKEKEYLNEVIRGMKTFFETYVGKNLLLSTKVEREKPFLVRIEANKIYDTKYDDDILLQGTADCYFVQNNKITLIDFKTDKRTDVNLIKKSYSKQIELYKYAIEKVTQLPVENSVIYTMRNGNIIEF